MRAEVVNEVSALGGIRTRVGPLRRRVRIHYATRAWRREPESNRRHGVCSPVPSQKIASAVRAPGLEPRCIGWRPIMLPLNITRASQRRAVRASGESRTRMVLATSEALVRTSIAGVGGTTGTRTRTFWVQTRYLPVGRRPLFTAWCACQELNPNSAIIGRVSCRWTTCAWRSR